MYSQHLPMPIEAFDLLPRKLGWKYEYWDGQAHISPSHHFATVALNIDLRAVKSPCKLRPATREDELQLIPAYLAAFHDTIEYCDWKVAEIAESAKKNIRGYFNGKRGTPLDCSKVAVISKAKVESKSIIGAALFVQTMKGQTLLDILFVIPEWQRKGVATALVSSALNELYDRGINTLTSRYQLGNEQSQVWHEKFGFVELPDLFLARWYYRQAEYELWRQEKIGPIMKSDRDKLLAEIDRWRTKVHELEAIAEKEGIATVVPSLKY